MRLAPHQVLRSERRLSLRTQLLLLRFFAAIVLHINVMRNLSPLSPYPSHPCNRAKISIIFEA